MEPLYSDGDKVLVKIQPDIEPGEIGIFIVDNEGYIKKKGDHELISVNPEYDNIPIGKFTNYRCFGKVLGKAEIVE
jgi:SOS-response transcriptional repressor LexA